MNACSSDCTFLPRKVGTNAGCNYWSYLRLVHQIGTQNDWVAWSSVKCEVVLDTSTHEQSRIQIRDLYNLESYTLSLQLHSTRHNSTYWDKNSSQSSSAGSFSCSNRSTHSASCLGLDWKIQYDLYQLHHPLRIQLQLVLWVAILTLKVPDTAIDALWHFETG